MKKYNMISFMKPADIMTLGSGLFGFFSILAVFHAYYYWAVLFMFISMLLDFFDGKVARRFGGGSDFGKALDFSDIIPFGVAPAFLVSALYPSIETYIITSLFVACGLLRLSRFMVTDTKYSIGIPITSSGLFFPLAYIIIEYFSLPYYWFLVLMVAMCYFMVTSKRISKII
jgi:CDP-diacylglycerol--serine O-phosphatidyltransferase